MSLITRGSYLFLVWAVGYMNGYMSASKVSASRFSPPLPFGPRVTYAARGLGFLVGFGVADSSGSPSVGADPTAIGDGDGEGSDDADSAAVGSGPIDSVA